MKRAGMMTWAASIVSVIYPPSCCLDGNCTREGLHESLYLDASDLGREIAADLDAAERVESFTFAVVPR